MNVTDALPVKDVPAYSPKLPVIVVGPVFVTVEAARTAKLEAFPSDTEVAPELEISSPKAAKGNIKLTATIASNAVLFDFKI